MLTPHVLAGLTRRFLATLVLLAPTALVLAATGAAPTPGFEVAAANTIGNGIYTLNLTTTSSPNAALLNGGTTALNTDGSSHGSFDALVWAPNSVTGTLDLIASDIAKGQIVRYSGPKYGTGTVIFNWATRGKGSGPARPISMAVDATGNLFVVSPSCSNDATAALWVMPYNTRTGNYDAPVLVDDTFNGVRTLALADLLVAGTAATPDGSITAWHAGDLVVLVGDSFNARVIVYSQAAINSVITTAKALKGPTSTPVTLAEFQAKSALPLGMAVWPADATHGVSLLFSTVDGRLLRFDSSRAAFVADFADGLGANVQSVRVGTYLNVPYAFVAQLLTSNNGEIRQYGAPPASGTNTTPLATITRSLAAPFGLAVTSSGSSPITQCETPGGCTPIGPQLTIQLTGPGVSGNPNLQNAQILETACTIPSDPRVQYVNGAWICNGGTLDVANYCPGFPHTVLPPFLCGHSGSTGAGLVVVEGTAITVDQNANNVFFTVTPDPTVPLPGANDLSCPQTPLMFPQLPMIAWAPRSDLPTVEGSVVEDANTPYFIDLTSYCDKSATNLKGGSMLSYGLGLNAAQSGLGSGPGGGLPGFATAKFTNLLATIQAATTISTPVSLTLQGYVQQAQNYFNSELNNGTADGYSCAANTLASADAYARANASAFTKGIPPAGNYNPLGEIDGRLANLYLTIDGYFLNQVVNTTWPATNVPPCVTLTASPATVGSGNAATLSWGPATPTYPLSYPPTSCTVFGSQGTLLATPYTGGGSGSVSTGALSTAGTYTASLECSATGSTAQGLAAATVTVSGTPVLQSIQVSPTSVTLPPGAAIPFHATGIFTIVGGEDLTSAVTWTSTNPTVGGVGSNGFGGCSQNGLGGMYTITASYNGISGMATVTCTAPTLTGLSLSSVPSSIELGGTLSLVATANYSDNATQVVTGSSGWSTSNASVATVSSSGVVTTLGGGTALISATYGGQTATVAVNVTDYTVTPTQSALTTNPGGTVNYALAIAAVGAFSDTVSGVSCSVPAAIASYAFSPATVTAGGTLSLQLNVPATVAAPVQTGFTCTVSSAGGDVHTVALQLSVVEPPGAITSFTAAGLPLLSSANAYTNTYSLASAAGGNSATLSWQASNVVADSCSLSDPNDASSPAGLNVTGLPAPGSYGVFPPAATTGVVPTVYTLVCLGLDGNNVSGTVTINVQPPTYTVGGSVVGLPAGASVALTDNGNDGLTITTSGPFTFAIPLVSGTSYTVTAASQTSGIVCTVQGGGGTIASANIISVVVTCGDSAPTLVSPQGMAFSTSGNLYVASYGSGQVLTFTPGTTYPTNFGQLVLAPGQTLSAGLTNPVRIAFDPTSGTPNAGNLYVADVGNGNTPASVVAYNAAGQVLGSAYTGVTRPLGIAVDENSVILVADNEGSGNGGPGNVNDIQVLSFGTGFTNVATLTGDNTGLAFQSVGALAYDPSTVAANALDSTIAAGVAGNNSVDFYWGPAIDQTTCDVVPCGAQQVGSEYAVVSPISTGVSGPTGIAFDPTGQNVYVTNYFGSTPLSAYQSSNVNDATSFAPLPGFALTGAPSPALTQPEGVAVDSTGNIYVSNTPNNSIYVYNSSGVFQYSIGNVSLQAFAQYDGGGNATTSAYLTWSAPGLPSSASCTLTSSDGVYSATAVSNAEGYTNFSVTPATASAPVTYTLTCGAPGYASSAASVQVPSVTVVPYYINNAAPPNGVAPTTAPKGASYQYQLNPVGVTTAGSCIFNAPPVLANYSITPEAASISYYFPNTAGPYTVSYSCNTGGATPIQTNTATWTINLY